MRVERVTSEYFFQMALKWFSSSLSPLRLVERTVKDFVTS